MSKAFKMDADGRLLPEGAKTVPAGATRVFRGEIYDVYQWPQKMFDGSTKTFEMLKRVDTVQIIAVKDGKIVVILEEQPHKEKFYGVPGGRVDMGEGTLEAAKRELLEETGMVFGDFELVDIAQPMSNIEWFVYTYVATGFQSQGEKELDNGERNEVFEMSYDEVLKLAPGMRLKRIFEILQENKRVKEILGVK
jgi:ADP-ribose pyrophosphatase YjhB (NUDIX family)